MKVFPALWAGMRPRCQRLLLAGFSGGAVVAATGTADAATGSSSSSSAKGHSGDTPLIGTTAAKLKAVALAKYPGATLERVDRVRRRLRSPRHH